VLGIPFLIDPRLVPRLLDDIHAIAEAARLLPTVEARLTERIASAESRLDDVIAAAAPLKGLGGRADGVLDGIDRVDVRAVELLAAVDRLDSVEARVAELVRLAEELRAGLPTLDDALGSIKQLNAAARTLAAAVEPLQGTAERLGRIADRLPGAQRRR